MVQKFRWCLPPVARLFGVCVCCKPDLSSYYLHGYDMRVRDWCESQWGHAGAGHGWSPGGAYRARRFENESLHFIVLLHPSS